MSMKKIRNLLEKIDNELGDIEFDLEDAVKEREYYESELSMKEEEMELLKDELRFLCQFLYEAKVEIPRDGHYTDINPYVPKEDPYKGRYEYE